MKVVSKLVILLGLSALFAVASRATEVTTEQSYLESCRKEPGVPVPVVVVSPQVGPELAGNSVELEFTVDVSGVPTSFSVKSVSDSALVDPVIDAVKQWRFKPAQLNGAPVATKVVLPVKIVDGSLSGDRYAAN